MSVFGVIMVCSFPHLAEYGEKNTDQSHSYYGHFSRSGYFGGMREERVILIIVNGITKRWNIVQKISDMNKILKLWK